MSATVMCYLSVGWYEPTADRGDGMEPPPLESAFDQRQKANRLAEQRGASAGAKILAPTAAPAKK